MGKIGWRNNHEKGEKTSYNDGKDGDDIPMSAEEFKKKMEEKAAERKAQLDEKAGKVSYLVNNEFKGASEHPYLDKKGVLAHGLLINK